MRRFVAVVAHETQDHVAAHREAGDVNFTQAFATGEFVRQDTVDVARHPAVVKRAREVLRVAAVAHVHADDVEPFAESLLRSAAHVERLA